MSNKSEQRLEALKAAGIGTENLLAAQAASTDGLLASIGKEAESGDDSILDGIEDGGTVANGRLYRRWVTSQMFHMISLPVTGRIDGEPLPRKTAYAKSFDRALEIKGYRYSWSMLLEEMRVQARLAENDSENYLERNRWFNRGVCVKFADHFIQVLKQHIAEAQKHNRKCKGRPYVRLFRKDIFVDDLKGQIYKPLSQKRDAIASAATPKALYESFKEFYNECVWYVNRLPESQPFCRKWVGAYKGSGAYYTLKNLILFHGCTAPAGDGEARPDRRESLLALEEAAERYSGNGQGLFSYMLKFLEANDVNIGVKITEWIKNGSGERKCDKINRENNVVREVSVPYFRQLRKK